MATAVDLSTAGIHVGYAIEATSGTKPTAFIDLPNPKSIPDFNPETGTYDVTSLNDTVWKRYIDGLKDPGGAIAITFGMTQVFLEMWETICDDYDTAKATNKRMWLEFYHPRLDKAFFFTCVPARMGWAASDVDSAWDTSVSVTPTGEIGWNRDLVAQWADNMSQAFDVANIVTPNVGTTYSVNREFFDMVDTKASVSLDKPSYDFKAGLSAELNAALSGIIDYDRLGNVLAEKLESAKITAELDSDKDYSNVKDKWKKEYSRNKTAPVPI